MSSNGTSIEKKDNKKIAVLMQIIKFGLVGVMNTVVSMAIYNICYHALGLNEQIANLFGFVISVFNAWIWQSKFVFKEDESGEKRVWWKVLLKTYVSYAFTGLFLTAALIFMWLKVIHIQDNLGGLLEFLRGYGFFKESDTYGLAVSLAPFLNMFITIPLNFIINKFWAYRQKDKKEA